MSSVAKRLLTALLVAGQITFVALFILSWVPIWEQFHAAPPIPLSERKPTCISYSQT